jgi:cytochrome P450
MENTIPNRPQIALAVFVAIIVYAVASLAFSTRPPKGFPPGPPRIWLLGNLHQIPAGTSLLKYHEWKKFYGSLLGLKFGPQNAVMLMTAAHVRELFDKRGIIYSDRPQAYITSKFICPDGILFMNYGSLLKKSRTALRNVSTPADIKRLLVMQNAQVAIFLRKLLDEPRKVEKHLKLFTLATPLAVISGQHLDKLSVDTEDFAEYYFASQERWLRFLNPSSAPPIEFFPFLKYLPAWMAEWKRDALLVKEEMERVAYELLIGGKLQHTGLSCGLSDPMHESLLAKIIRQAEESGECSFTDRQLAFFASAVLDAAVDTVFETTRGMLFILAAFPEVQKSIQAELDSMCPDKPPGPDDIPTLKYLRACLFEVSMSVPCLEYSCLTVN